MFDKDSEFVKKLDRIMKRVKDHYKKSICTSRYATYCTKRELAFGQFITSGVTLNPMTELQLPSTRTFADWDSYLDDFFIDDQHFYRPFTINRIFTAYFSYKE